MSGDKNSSRGKRARKEPKPSKTALRVERAKVVVPHAGVDFTHKHYIFIAKLKRGEVWALNQLSFEAKPAVTPLLELWPPQPATTTQPGKTLVQHSTDLLQMLTTEWTGLPCYLDTKYLLTGGQPSPAAVQTVFNIARNLNVIAVPVTSPNFGQTFQEAIRNVAATDGRGVMFRLTLDLFNAPQNLGGYLDGLTTFLGLARNRVDILVDLQYRPNVVEVQQMGTYCLNNLPFISDWRTVTLAAGCFPNSISDEPAGQWIDFQRSDWNGWNVVAGQRFANAMRVPTYGDYGVRCGGEPLVIPNTPAPNIRYTDNQAIRVRKGTKTPGAMRAICANLIGQTFFRGAAFSQGDAQIAQKATTTGQTNGSAEQWIQWCTNHHIELAVSQIQNLPWP
jgi:Beta protein